MRRPVPVGARWTQRRGPLWPPLVLLVLGLVRYGRYWQDPWHRTIGVDDTYLFAWYIGWAEHCVQHAANPFYSHALNAPVGVNTMWNTGVFAAGLALAPLTHAVGALVATNMALALSPVLSAVSAYWAVRRLTGNVWGGLVAGLLFGFGPYAGGQSVHLHLILMVLIPPIFVLVHDSVVHQRRAAWRAGVLLGLLLALQLLIAEEMLLLTAIALTVMTLLAAALQPGEVRPRARHLAVVLAVAAAVALVVSAVPLWFQFFGPGAVRGGQIQYPRYGRGNLLAFVLPSRLLALHTAGSDRSNTGFGAAFFDNTVYLGVPLIGLLVVIGVHIVRRRDRFGAFLFVSTALLIALSWGSPVGAGSGVLGPGPWAVFAALPVTGNALPNRLSGLVLLLVGVLIARWLVSVGGRTGRPPVLVAVALVVALLPLVPAPPPVTVSATVPQFFRSGAPGIADNANVLLLPYPDFATPAPMLWQAAAGYRFRIYAGYSVFTRPDGTPSFVPVSSAFATTMSRVYRGRSAAVPPADYAALLASARAVHLDWVVIAPGPHSVAALSAARAITGCVPRRVGGVDLCHLA